MHVTLKTPETAPQVERALRAEGVWAKRLCGPDGAVQGFAVTQAMLPPAGSHGGDRLRSRLVLVDDFRVARLPTNGVDLLPEFVIRH